VYTLVLQVLFGDTARARGRGGEACARTGESPTPAASSAWPILPDLNTQRPVAGL